METLGKILKWLFIALVVVVIGGILTSIIRSIIGLFRR